MKDCEQVVSLQNDGMGYATHAMMKLGKVLAKQKLRQRRKSSHLASCCICRLEDKCKDTRSSE
jgi:hypothetical protein